MKRTPYFANWQGITKVSFGVFVVILYCFLLFHTFQFVDPSQEQYWWTAVISYTVMFSLVLAVEKARANLFKVTSFDYLLRFLIFYVPSFFVLSWLLQYVPFGDVGVLGLLDSIPPWLLFTHAFVFVVIESCFWQGWLDYPYPVGLGHPWSELSAGIFHWGIWLGGALIVIPSATILFFIFSLFNWYFRKNTEDVAPVHGFHTAFNHIKLLFGGV